MWWGILKFSVARRRSSYVLSRCFLLSFSLSLFLSLLTYSALLLPARNPLCTLSSPTSFAPSYGGSCWEEHPFSDSYTSPIPTIRPTSPAICHSIPFRPFHLIPIVPSLPRPLFPSQCLTVFTLVTLRPLGVHPNALRLVWFSTWYQSALYSRRLYFIISLCPSSEYFLRSLVRICANFVLRVTGVTLSVCGLVSSIDWFQRAQDTLSSSRDIFSWNVTPRCQSTSIAVNFILVVIGTIYYNCVWSGK